MGELEFRGCDGGTNAFIDRFVSAVCGFVADFGKFFLRNSINDFRNCFSSWEKNSTGASPGLISRNHLSKSAIQGGCFRKGFRSRLIVTD